MRSLLVAALILASTPAAAERSDWEVRVTERVELAPGEQGALPISIAVDRGRTVSKDAAVIVDLVPPPGVVVKRRRLGRGDAVDPGADAPRFSVPVRAEAVGEHLVHVRVRFWVCQARTCRPIDVRRTAAVVIVALAAPVEPVSP
ncbi:MAG: hypothetical protein SFX73_10755 [Kofleriaceae bacterium]|nr:hypothetical protein [Kofleriaceae bacterium]